MPSFPRNCDRFDLELTFWMRESDADSGPSYSSGLLIVLCLCLIHHSVLFEDWRNLLLGGRLSKKKCDVK